MEHQGRDRQRNRGFFSGMLRGVSNPREGSKNLFFLFRPRVVCSSLLHLRSSWNADNDGEPQAPSHEQPRPGGKR
jgi:hypothetical protein